MKNKFKFSIHPSIRAVDKDAVINRFSIVTTAPHFVYTYQRDFNSHLSCEQQVEKALAELKLASTQEIVSVIWEIVDEK